MLKTNCFIIVFLIFNLLGCTFSSKNSQKQIENKDVNIEQITVLTFEKKYHHFGDIHQGEIVGCYFKFKNEGDHPLMIYNVKAGCGCTKVNYSKKPILPNQIGDIEVRFDTRGFSGNQYKVIRVEANIENKIKELVLSANVIN